MSTQHLPWMLDIQCGLTGLRWTRFYSLEIISQLKREENIAHHKNKTRELCNLPTSVICVELAFCTLLNIPHPTTEAIIPFLFSRKVVGTRKASMNLARVRINVSSPSGKGEAGRRKCVYSSGFSATCSLRAMLWGVKLSFPVPETMPGPRKLS